MPDQGGPIFTPEAVAEIMDRGGWCHRNFYAFLTMIPTRQSALDPTAPPTMAPVPIEAAAPCVGRYGICQLWDEEKKQCRDTTLIKLQIEYYENAVVQQQERGMGS
jgi:hypothetical protein